MLRGVRLTESGAMVMEVDHEKQVVYTEPLALSPRDTPSLLAAMQPSQENTAQRLTSPIVSTHLNTRNIAFERYGPTLPNAFNIAQKHIWN